MPAMPPPVSPLGERYLAVTRRELWGDGCLIWAIEHSPGAYETSAEAVLDKAAKVAAEGQAQTTKRARHL